MKQLKYMFSWNHKCILIMTIYRFKIPCKQIKSTTIQCTKQIKRRKLPSVNHIIKLVYELGLGTDLC